MTTLKQIEANQRNAQLSTGPKSEEGKAVVRENAVKHGILSRASFVEKEDEAVFNEFSRGLWTTLAPVGALEDHLADRVVSCAWRLRRLVEIESLLFAPEPLDRLDNQFSKVKTSEKFRRHQVTLRNLSRYESGIERILSRSLTGLKHLQAERRGPCEMARTVDLVTNK